MAKTIREKLAYGLITMGYKNTGTKSGFMVFEKVYSDSNTITLFLGPSGAMRKGKSPSNSYSIGCPAYTMRTPIYEKALAIANGFIPE